MYVPFFPFAGACCPFMAVQLKAGDPLGTEGVFKYVNDLLVNQPQSNLNPVRAATKDLFVEDSNATTTLLLTGQEGRY